MQLKFYKENGRWYADVPGHTQEENEMVSGSDAFLEYISEGKSEVTITMEITPNRHTYDADAVLYQLKHDTHGATYHVTSFDEQLDCQTLWICNVTHDVLGEHPPYIFIFWK